MNTSNDSFAERTGGPAIDRLSALSTAAISDALDSLGLPGSLAGIRALTPDVRATGPAFPVAYAPITEKTGTVGDFLDDVPAGAVVVIDNAGRTDCTVWGGIMTQTAAARGVAGTVVHGACRDVATTLSEQYPMWSSGVFMRTGKDRVQMVSAGQPVVIDGVTVAAGDVVCGDADGVVVVPAARTTEVAELAERIERVEAEIVAAVRAGSGLRQARSELGYHRLQSRMSGADPAAAGGHSVATLYEASGLPITCDPGLRAAWPGARLVGPAYTVRGVGGDNLALHNAVVTAPPGHVLVVDVQGAAYGHWGEVLAVAAQVRGLVGLVIDGGVRDLDELARLDFPVFARMVTVLGTGKHHPGELGVPVTVGGVTVHTGDVIVGDADGVVVLPQRQVGAIVARADARVAKERRILDQLRIGRITLELYDLDPRGAAGAPQGRGGLR